MHVFRKYKLSHGPSWSLNPPEPMPENALYQLKVGVLAGCDLPRRTNLAIRVSWGVSTQGSSEGNGTGMDSLTRPSDALAEEKTGLTCWNQLLFLDLEWPRDQSQVPDLLIELFDLKKRLRTHFLRCALRSIGGVGGMVPSSSLYPC